MKNSEVRELSTKELRERIDTEKENLVRMRLNHAVSPLDNPIRLRDLKKDVARLMTELKKRELGQSEQKLS
ncbi:MAG: 50S ribosomal protein L29 [Bacteroidales bacterium]|jgi:large subunit ribosomal protein L29|nr:50S ribosomal protein L29 [Bacteroidales bacterium]